MIFHTMSLILFAAGGCSAFLTPGSCSRRCNERMTNVFLGKDKISRKYPCSCSPSCAVYGDCCYDSSYRKKGYWNKGVSSVCLPIFKSRQYLAVSSCPSSFNGSSAACLRGTWNLSPVTSRKTGVTYTNIYCAICNDDNEETISWNARLICCSSAQRLAKESHFMSVRDTLWKVLVDGDNGLIFCQCKYWIHQESVLGGLELRPCERNEKSTCSITWKDVKVYSACKSYIDPINVQGTIYRNLHCAKCNYLKPSEATCPSFFVDAAYLQEFGHQGLIRCSEDNSEKCFLLRGQLYSFSELFHINERKCLPPPGSRCCVGQQYDFRRKRCRKIVN